MTALQLGPSTARTAVLHRRVRLVVASAIAYNAVEAVIALSAGAVASSSALIGFGLGSVVEVGSAAAVAWQFAGGAAQVLERERPALRAIALSFFGLAALVSVDALRVLLGAAEPGPSVVGIVLAAVSLTIMPGLSWVQRCTGRELVSASVVADSKQTLICSWMSAVLLLGLLLNATLGWSWADPVAALVLAAVAVREGREAWRGDACCASSAALFTDPDATSVPSCGCSSSCADHGCTAQRLVRADGAETACTAGPSAARSSPQEGSR